MAWADLPHLKKIFVHNPISQMGIELYILFFESVWPFSILEQAQAQWTIYRHLLESSGVLVQSSLGNQGPVSQKSREHCGPEKPFVKVRPAYSVKLVFSYVVKGIKTKITAKFRALRRLRFEDTKRIISPEIRPKSFGTFEKQAPGHFSWNLLMPCTWCI